MTRVMTFLDLDNCLDLIRRDPSDIINGLYSVFTRYLVITECQL